MPAGIEKSKVHATHPKARNVKHLDYPTNNLFSALYLFNMDVPASFMEIIFINAESVNDCYKYNSVRVALVMSFLF